MGGYQRTPGAVPGGGGGTSIHRVIEMPWAFNSPNIHTTGIEVGDLLEGECIAKDACFVDVATDVSSALQLFVNDATGLADFNTSEFDTTQPSAGTPLSTMSWITDSERVAVADLTIVAALNGLSDTTGSGTIYVVAERLWTP